MKISHFNPNQSAPSIYIMIELCYFSLDQWEIRIHLLWGKSFNIPHHCDPHLNQTKCNDLLPLTIHGVLDIVCAKLGGLCIANFAKELSPERAFDLLKVGLLGWLPSPENLRLRFGPNNAMSLYDPRWKMSRRICNIKKDLHHRGWILQSFRWRKNKKTWYFGHSLWKSSGGIPGDRNDSNPTCD